MRRTAALMMVWVLMFSITAPAFAGTFTSEAAILRDGKLMALREGQPGAITYEAIAATGSYESVDEYAAYEANGNAGVFSKRLRQDNSLEISGILKNLPGVKQVTNYLRGNDSTVVCVLFNDGRYIEYEISDTGETAEGSKRDNVRKADLYDYGYLHNSAYLTNSGELYVSKYISERTRSGMVQHSLTGIIDFITFSHSGSNHGSMGALQGNGDFYRWEGYGKAPSLVVGGVKEIASSNLLIKNNGELLLSQENDSTGEMEYIKIFDDAVAVEQGGGYGARGSNTYVLDSKGTLWGLLGQEDWISDHSVKDGLLLVDGAGVRLTQGHAKDGSIYKDAPDEFKTVESVAELSKYNPRIVNSHKGGRATNFVWLTVAENVLAFGATHPMWVLQKDGTLLLADNTNQTSRKAYILTPAMTGVRDVMGYYEMAVVLKEDGTLWRCFTHDAPVKVLDNVRTPIAVKLNGMVIPFDTQPIIEDGRTLVPLRAIFEAIGASVEWNGATQTVTATSAGVTVTLQIGSSVMHKNGTAVTLDVPAKITDGRTLVPVRAISEAFDAVVEWDGTTQTVRITK